MIRIPLIECMAQDGPAMGTHVPHDSGLSMGSAAGDAVKVRELEDEVKYLAEKANNACMYRARNRRIDVALGDQDTTCWLATDPFRQRNVSPTTRTRSASCKPSYASSNDGTPPPKAIATLYQQHRCQRSPPYPALAAS